MNTPAQLVIGNDVFNKLSLKEKNKFEFYKNYKNINEPEWFGDNYFYDEEDLAIFWGVKNIADIDGSLYVRKFDNFSKDDEFWWRSLGEKGTQVKVFWC